MCHQCVWELTQAYWIVLNYMFKNAHWISSLINLQYKAYSGQWSLITEQMTQFGLVNQKWMEKNITEHQGLSDS